MYIFAKLILCYEILYFSFQTEQATILKNSNNDEVKWKNQELEHYIADSSAKDIKEVDDMVNIIAKQLIKQSHETDSLKMENDNLKISFQAFSSELKNEHAKDIKELKEKINKYEDQLTKQTIETESLRKHNLDQSVAMRRFQHSLDSVKKLADQLQLEQNDLKQRSEDQSDELKKQHVDDIKLVNERINNTNQSLLQQRIENVKKMKTINEIIKNVDEQHEIQIVEFEKMKKQNLNQSNEMKKCQDSLKILEIKHDDGFKMLNENKKHLIEQHWKHIIEIENIKRQNLNHSSEIKSFQNSLLVLKTEHVSDIKVLDGKISNLNQQVSTQMMKTESLRKQKREQSNEITQFGNSLMMIKSEHAKDIRILNEQIYKHDARLLKQTDETGNLTKQNDHQTNEIKNLQNFMIMLNDECGQIRIKQKTLEENISKNKALSVKQQMELSRKIELNKNNVDKSKNELRVDLNKYKNDNSLLITKLNNTIIDCKEKQTSNGYFIWKIEQFTQLQENAKLSPINMIYSDSFYTHAFGYKMRLILYPNGDNTDSDLSIYLQLMPGPFDAILNFGLMYTAEISLINQLNPDLDHSNTATIKIFPGRFSDSLMSLGYKYFVSLRELKPLYIKNDTIFVRVYVTLN